MRFRFRVDVEVERIEGLFESRDDLGAELIDSIELSDPGTIEGSNGGSYETVAFDVEEVPAS